MSREWRGIEVDERLTDKLLDRLFTIPGIAVYDLTQFSGFIFTPYPWPPKSQAHSLTKELKEAYSDIAEVQTADAGPITLSYVTPREMPTVQWWDNAIERLENFASKRPVTSPTIEDFERDILLGASEVFSFKQQVWPHERYDGNPRKPATPASEDEARRFLEALAELNRSSVYDLYLDDLESFRGVDLPIHRWRFGHEAALRGLGLWHRATMPPPVDYRVPAWWSVAPGSFDVCVLQQPLSRELALYSILLGHPESGISTKFTLDPRPRSEDFLVHSGCSKDSSYFLDNLHTWEDYARDSTGYKLVCKGMPGSEIPDYVARLFPRWERERVVAAVERVLAGCFAKDR